MANRILHNSRKSITPRITWKPVRVPQEFGNVTQSVPRCPRYEAAFYRLYNGRRIKTRQAQALSLLLRLKKNIAVKLFFDLFPIILFFGAFKFGESDPQTAADILTLITGGTGPEHAPVMLATLVAIVSTFVQIAIVFARGKKPDFPFGLFYQFFCSTIPYHFPVVQNSYIFAGSFDIRRNMG